MFSHQLRAAGAEGAKGVDAPNVLATNVFITKYNKNKPKKCKV